MRLFARPAFSTRAFQINDASVALSEIDSIGPGGNFLISDLTVALCREIDFTSSIWPNLVLDEWQIKGNPQADKVLRTRTRDLLDNLPIPEDHAEMIARGESFIRKKTT